jgi:hypothetical protein
MAGRRRTRTRTEKVEEIEEAVEQLGETKIKAEKPIDDIDQEAEDRERVTEKKFFDVVITARNDIDTHEGSFVFNGVVIPLGVPVKADKKAINMIKQMKTYKRTANKITPYQYAQENGITIEEAQKILSVSGDGMVVSEDQIAWESKYLIEYI